MHECHSAEYSVPLHVQLTENHIHDNDKLSYKRPKDKVAAVFFSQNILIISKLALSPLWLFSFAQQPRKIMQHLTGQHTINYEPLSQWAQGSLSLELRDKVTSIPQVVTTSPLDNWLDILPEPAAILSSLSPWTQAAYILDNSRDKCQKNKTCYFSLTRLLVKEK